MYSPIQPVHQMYTIHCFSLVETTKNSRFFPDQAAHRDPSARRRIVNTGPGSLKLLKYMLLIYRLYKILCFVYILICQNMCKIVMYENILEHIVI